MYKNRQIFTIFFVTSKDTLNFLQANATISTQTSIRPQTENPHQKYGYSKFVFIVMVWVLSLRRCFQISITTGETEKKSTCSPVVGAALRGNVPKQSGPSPRKIFKCHKREKGVFLSRFAPFYLREIWVQTFCSRYGFVNVKSAQQKFLEEASFPPI